MRMNKDDLIGAIYSDLERATDYASTQLRQIRKDSWDAHLGRNAKPAPEGRSQLIDTSVPDTTESIMAQISEQWSNSNICSFGAEGPNDEAQAEAEGLAISALFWSDNCGYMESQMMAKNALQHRNGPIKCWLDTDPEVEVRAFPDRAALAGLPKDSILSEKDTEDGVQVTLEIPQQRLRFKAVEPAYLFVDPNADSTDMQDMAFIAERVFFTRSELQDMGVSRGTIERLQASPDESVTDGIGASNTDVTAKFIDGQNDKGDAATRDQDRIECYWVWMKLDRDGDGLSERWRFLVSHRNLLLDDPHPGYWPWAAAVPWIVPNRWSGLGVYDKLKQTSLARTNAYRQMADNMNLINNPRPAADPGEVEFADLLSAAPGRPIRKKVRDAVIDWQPVSDLVSNSLAFLEYTGKVRSEQAGSSLDMVAKQDDLQQISGISAELQMGPAEQMAAMVARNMAITGLQNILLVAHRIVREQWRGPVQFYKSGEWQETVPAEWRPRKRIMLNLAMSPGEARRKVAALDWVINMQMQLIAGGAANIAATWEGMHKAITDRMMLTRLDQTDEYFADPASQASQQAQQAAAQQNQQMDAMQAQMAEMQLAIEQFKADDDAKQWRAELEHKYYDTNMDAEAKEADLTERAINNDRIAGASNGTADSTGQSTGGGGSAG